jgi:LPXTG-motif cell wall-anchored protein
MDPLVERWLDPIEWTADAVLSEEAETANTNPGISGWFAAAALGAVLLAALALWFARKRQPKAR